MTQCLVLCSQQLFIKCRLRCCADTGANLAIETWTANCQFADLKCFVCLDRCWLCSYYSFIHVWMPLDGASTCQWVLLFLYPVVVLLAIPVKRRDPHARGTVVSLQFKVWVKRLVEESLRPQVAKRAEPQGASGRLWGSTLALWSQNG